MKKRILTLSITICSLAMVLSSYEHGPAYEGGLNRTGSQGGVANCAGSGCHEANTPTTIVAVTVTNAAGAVVTEYTPATTYTVTIRGNNTAAGITTGEFGFQVSAVNSGLTQAGTFTAASGSNIRVVTLAGLQIVEHKKPLDDSSTNHSVARFTWTAPAAGAGTVKLHGILNALGEGDDGDDDDDDDGDKSTNGTAIAHRDDDDDDDDDDDEIAYPNVAPVVTLTEHGGSNGGPSAVYDVASAGGMTLFPNPCTNELHIAVNGDYMVRIYNASGMPVYNGNGSASLLQAGSINTADLPMGVYYLEVLQGDNKISRTFVKQ